MISNVGGKRKVKGSNARVGEAGGCTVGVTEVGLIGGRLSETSTVVVSRTASLTNYLSILGS